MRVAGPRRRYLGTSFRGGPTVTDYEMVVALGGCVIAFAILGAIVAWITQPR